MHITAQSETNKLTDSVKEDKSMGTEYFPDKTVDFNLRLEDESGENWRNAKGVISVELPKIAFDGGEKLLDITSVRIFFTKVEDALAVEKAKETRLRVRAAEQLSDIAGGYTFIGRQHILDIERPSVQFCPGITKRNMPAYALCEFTVKKYTMTFDGEEVLYASVEDKVLRIK